MTTPLHELDAEFLTHTPRGFHRGNDIATAQGILFVCPSCYRKNGSSDIGVHSVLVWFANRGVPDEAEPLPRWNVSGTSLADVSITPSINLATDEASQGEWHGYITNGYAT
jgi:hypothetical protein